ncbi:MAG: hypothetical protein HOQ11_17160 [Gemmatimonadaceae bacterium]|nr:hypothetical protein [Gemmatimonadaceae bacterium]NUQ93080.1 hypothetical protein [Gemmatimonadaceae bacterium]NUR18472.1 hypothetical protein [Gemmatimonadaceae bacterium]NUS99135.1 hypothetical protein [Gemmatimonadaceae bacterium]
MRILVLVSALVLPPRHANPVIDSVRAQNDSINAVSFLNDLTVAIGEVARRNGFDPAVAPDGWLEPAYIASARTRPDIQMYFKRKAAYAADLAAHMDSIAAAVVDRQLDDAGYPADERGEMKAAFLRGFDRASDRQRVILQTMRRQSRMALTLHAFLVKADPYVKMDPKTHHVLFTRPRDHRRYNELAYAIDAANGLLAQAAGVGAKPASAGNGQP